MIPENYLKWMLCPLTRYGTKQLGGASEMWNNTLLLKNLKKLRNILSDSKYFFDSLAIRCCVFRPANACLGMRSHFRKRLKTLENE